MQRIVSRQACSSGVDDSVVVDPKAHLPYDMMAEAALLGMGLVGGRRRTEHIRLRRGVVYGRA